jgi:hypothetical protein
MLQKRRRTLTIEYLEDRTTPSGLVTAIQDPFTGAVFISGDNFNNQFMLNRTASVLGDVLSVAPIPFSHTAVNGLTSGNPANFLLSSVSNIFISDGNGSNTILLGNLNGFSIPGNIQIDVGHGVDFVALKNITTNSGGITFNGTHGNGHGTDTVNYTNVVAGLSSITPGRGSLTLNQTNVTLGFDLINANAASRGGSQDGNDSISITNSTFHPAPRLHAIGQLTITDGNKDNTFSIDTIDVGPASITSGTGNNSLKFNHSTILQADTLFGTEAAGARGNNNITMDTDTIIGQHVNIQTLNESGVSGFLNTPGATTPGVVATTNNVAPSPDGGHRNQRHVNHVTLNNMKFTTAFPVFTPQLGVRMDDGDYYYDTQRGHVNGLSGSSFVATGVTVKGIMQVNLGDHFQNVQLGNLGSLVNGVPGATTQGQVIAGQLLLSAENDLDTVTVAANVTGQFLPVIGLPVPVLLPASELIQLGDNTINPVQGTLFGASANDQLALPYVFTSGQVGTAAIDGNYELTLGNNLSMPGFVNGNNSGSPLGWPVKQIETVIGHLDPTFLSGNLIDGSTVSTPAPVGGPTSFTLPATLPKLEVGQNGVTSPDKALITTGSDGLAIFLDPTIVQGDLRIFMGSGGFNNRESLVMNGVTAGNVFVTLNSNGPSGQNPGDTPDGNPNLGVYIALDHVTVTDTIFGDVFDGSPPGLTLTDIGHGTDIVTLGLIPSGTAGLGFGGGAGPVAGDFLNVAGEMFVTLSDSGGNALEAHNTTTAFGIVSGGGGSSTYTDDGGNFGFFVTGFVGH